MKETEIKTALILVDVQSDFCPEGKLAVTDGHHVVEPLNNAVRYAREHGWLIVTGRDWHPAITTHFAKDGGVWPEHCVQETIGAEFHTDLDIDGAIVVSKGTRPDEDGYSEFDGHTEDGKTLEELLKTCGKTRVLVGGLATDYCVKATALDAARLGFETYVLLDAIKAVNLQPDDEAKAVAEMVRGGVKFTQTIYLEMLG